MTSKRRVGAEREEARGRAREFFDKVKGIAKLEPAFISVQSNSKEKSVDIWPFLLEKAYANYYARY